MSVADVDIGRKRRRIDQDTLYCYNAAILVGGTRSTM